MSQLFRYLLVGVLNTGWGYLLIFGFMALLGWSPERSNAAGYSIGLLTSYLLNRLYTFQSVNRKREEFVRFLLIFAVAYGCNLGCLSLLVRGFEVNAYVSQILAGIVYIAVSFLLNKIYVFRAR